MPEFLLTTTWTIPAPLEAVWSCLIDTDTWPAWWKYVETVEEKASGEATGLNNSRTYRWRTCLPYNLIFNLCVVDIQPMRQVSVGVTGDLQGDGCCRFTYQPTDGVTLVEFRWHVKTCKPWMNWFTRLSYPVFKWNHERVMKQGEKSLIRHLAALQTHSG